MTLPALRLSANETLLLSSVVSYSFRKGENGPLLVIELVDHRSLSFTGTEAESIHATLQQSVHYYGG